MRTGYVRGRPPPVTLTAYPAHMSDLRLKPPGQEVPVLVQLDDGTLVEGVLWAWCRDYLGNWRAWVRGPGLESRAWPVERLSAR